MGRPRKPIGVSKRHYTKAELEEKRKAEIKGNNDNIVTPDFLTSDQKKEFEYISSELDRLEIMSNLDTDTLAQYVKAKDSYLFYSATIEKIKKKCKTLDDILEYTNFLKEYEALKDKAFKQCQTCANALGLNITSRCKLVKPAPKEEKPPENKFAKFQMSG